MVDVGVGQQHRRYPGGIEGERAIIQGTQRFGALEHAAIDQKLAARRDQAMARAGDRARSAMNEKRSGHANDRIAILIGGEAEVGGKACIAFPKKRPSQVPRKVDSRLAVAYSGVGLRTFT
jgi:hypothetical protein